MVEMDEAHTPFLACAICPSTDPRPASVTCANGCGRHVCVDHARPLDPATRGPLVCMDCWETTFQYGQNMPDGGYRSLPLPIRTAVYERQMRQQSSSPRSFVRITLMLVMMIMMGLTMLVILMMNR
jgi:hypothetical protein